MISWNPDPCLEAQTGKGWSAPWCCAQDWAKWKQTSWCCLVNLLTFISVEARVISLLNRSLWSLTMSDNRNILSVSSCSAGDGVAKIFTVMVIHLIDNERQQVITLSKLTGKSDSAWFYNRCDLVWVVWCTVTRHSSEGAVLPLCLSLISLGKPVLHFLPTPRWKKEGSIERQSFLWLWNIQFKGYLDYLGHFLFTLSSCSFQRRK